jgi:hypothetical protein
MWNGIMEISDGRLKTGFLCLSQSRNVFSCR